MLWFLRKSALCSEKLDHYVLLILYKESELSEFVSTIQSCVGEIYRLQLHCSSCLSGKLA